MDHYELHMDESVSIVMNMYVVFYFILGHNENQQ